MKTGNSKIFEKMLDEASSNVRTKMNTNVDRVFRLAPGAVDGIIVESTCKKEDGSTVKEREVFDAVIVACPIVSIHLIQ